MVKSNEVLGELKTGPEPMGQAIVTYEVNGQPAGVERLPAPDQTPIETARKTGKTIIHIGNIVHTTNQSEAGE